MACKSNVTNDIFLEWLFVLCCQVFAICCMFCVNGFSEMAKKSFTAGWLYSKYFIEFLSPSFISLAVKLSSFYLLSIWTRTSLVLFRTIKSSKTCGIEFEFSLLNVWFPWLLVFCWKYRSLFSCLIYERFQSCAATLSEGVPRYTSRSDTKFEPEITSFGLTMNTSLSVFFF